MSANVETMMYVREKPRHGLGTLVPEAPTSADALRFAGWSGRCGRSPATTPAAASFPATSPTSAIRTAASSASSATATRSCRISTPSTSPMTSSAATCATRRREACATANRSGCSPKCPRAASPATMWSRICALAGHGRPRHHRQGRRAVRGGGLTKLINSYIIRSE